MNEYIGVFDSGVGGLTVLNSLKKTLPNESFIYFGDTKNLPYGDKSKNTIIEYSEKICSFLLEKNCKAIVIACNSASANSYDFLRDKITNQIPIVDVINPTVNFTLENNLKNIGIIATRATINSNIYSEKIINNNPEINTFSLATPLLVNLIEDGFIDDYATELILDKYLSSDILKNIDGLILGCTHYPILEEKINLFYKRNNKNVKVINSANSTAEYLKSILEKKDILSTEKILNDKFFISDYSDVFMDISKIILNKNINLEVV